MYIYVCVYIYKERKDVATDPINIKGKKRGFWEDDDYGGSPIFQYLQIPT